MAISSRSESFKITVFTPDGMSEFPKAQSLSGFNAVGAFSVIPKHANFISVIKGPVIISLESGTKQEIAVENGVIRVRRDRVDLYVDFELDSIPADKSVVKNSVIQIGVKIA